MIAIERGLPQNLDAERLILGSLLLDCSRITEVRSILRAQDFALEKHRRIFGRMCQIDDRAERFDGYTLANELMKAGELESVDGLTYLVSLDEGMPRMAVLEGYLRIVRDKSTLRALIGQFTHGIDRCMLAGDDSADVIAGAEKALAVLQSEAIGVSRWVTPAQVIQNYPGGLGALLTPSRGGAGIPFPWHAITERTCGMQKGDMILVAGRPGMGKSAAGLQICDYAAQLGVSSPAYISLEMSSESLVRRQIAQKSHVDAQKTRAGYLNSGERQQISKATEQMEQFPIWIDDTRNQTQESIRQSLKRRAAEQPIGLIVIDHFHLVRGHRSQEIRERYADIADAMQGWGKEFGCPVVVLCQLNRDCEKENRPPGLSDLKETGKLEENADLILFVHRPEMYTKMRDREELRGTAEMIIGKQRNGPTGKVNLVWLAGCQRFESCAEDIPDEPSFSYEERER